MQYLAAVNWPGFVVFSALIMALAMFGLTVATHFPIAVRAPHMQTWRAKLVIAGGMVVAAIAAALAIGFAAERLPAPVTIIGAGGALLAAPLMLRRVPDRILNGEAGLIAFAGMCGLLAFVINRLAG